MLQVGAARRDGGAIAGDMFRSRIWFKPVGTRPQALDPGAWFFQRSPKEILIVPRSEEVQAVLWRRFRQAMYLLDAAAALYVLRYCCTAPPVSSQAFSA